MSGKITRNELDSSLIQFIESNASESYVHPSTHPATMITEDTTHRFVTDTEKSTWNAKASTTVATTSANGLMSSSDKSKLNGIATGANNYTHPSTHDASMITQSSSYRFVTDTEKSTWNAKASTAIATQSANGLMAAADKKKLDGVATGANNYVHPSTHAASIITQSSSYRFVTDTEKSTWNAKASTTTATQSANGLMAATDKKKLDGIATGANNYTHPSTHAATMITEDTTHRFVTDTEKSTWNAKASTAIATQSANGLMAAADKKKLNGIATGANNYIHPSTHAASMISGLARVATSGSYSDLSNRPTKLSQFTNDIGAGTSSVSTTLDNYNGTTLNDKMVAMFNDINTNHKNTPMLITLPDGVIEITQNLTAVGWTNKIFKGECILYFKNCDGIEFKQCQHNDIYIHRASSEIPRDSSNPQGFIGPSEVAKLTKRGIKITDCCYNKFEFNTILGFTNAIEINSEYGNLGSCYNNIYFTAIWRCQRPIIFKCGKAADDTSRQSGWITEIYVHGGMFDCNDGILIGQELANRPANEPSDNYQGLKFYNIGIEHIRNKENGIGIYFLQGKNNAVINPRFEGSLGTGNSTSGAYILVKESGYACNNRIETSNYPINIDRVQLNFAAKQLTNPNYDNPAGSYIEGDLYDNSGFKCGWKAIATPGKMVYEAKNMNNYYFGYAKNNTLNFTYNTTEFAKVKDANGTIRIVGYTS